MNPSQPLDGSSSSTDDSTGFLSPQRPAHTSWGSAVTANSSISSRSDMPAPKPSLKPAFTDGSAVQAMMETTAKQNVTLVYPALEITRKDNSKGQAMEAMRHIERTRPGLITGAQPKISLDSSGQESATILNYIQDLERKIAELQASNRHEPTPQVNLEERLEEMNHSTEALASPDLTEERRSLSRSPIPQKVNPWIVDIKRYKKLNYRFGSAELYDDSENIEAIRARESAARGGGYVIKLYREYDCE
jgi:hypothetical protein